MKRTIHLLFFFYFFTVPMGKLYAQIDILDKTFGEGGKTALLGPNNFSGSLITDISILPNKKIIACGIIHDSTGSVILFASRYYENGMLDSSFGTNGYFIADGKLKAWDAKLTTDQDGSLYIYGYHAQQFQYAESPFLLRLFEDGTLDTSFAEEGIYGLNDTIGSANIYCVYIEKDKSLKVIGQAYFGYAEPILPYIQKFTSNGQLDPSFGTNGRKLIRLEDTVSIAAINASIDTESRLLLFVCIDPINVYNYSVIRTSLDGVVDSTFGDKGVAQVRIGNAETEYTAGLIMPDNSLLCIMNSSTTSYQVYIDIVKILSNGEIDNSFGQSGVARLKYDNVSCRAYKCIIDNDNNIVVAGHVSGLDNISYSPSVFRLLNSGGVDSSFSLYGVSIPFPSNRGESYAVAVTENSKYVVGGQLDVATLLYRLYPPKVSSISRSTDNTSNNTSLFPNPTPSTDNCTVTYTLPTNGDCTLTLRDESGREVRGFARDEYRTLGEHTEELDLRGLASGVYFLQIESGGAVQTAKLIKQ